MAGGAGSDCRHQANGCDSNSRLLQAARCVARSADQRKAGWLVKRQTSEAMKRIGILTAGGDTPALNATIHGAVVRANQLKIELYGFIKGFNSFFNPRVPHVHLNPLFQGIPELDPTKGGTLIGSSRDYVDPDKKDELDLVASRLQKVGIDGLICIGGDGAPHGLQPLGARLPTVLAPQTTANDLALNYAH